MKSLIYPLLAVLAGVMLGGCQSINPDALDAYYYVLDSDEYAIDRATPVYNIDRRVFQLVRETGCRERPEKRSYHEGDLDGDRAEDPVLLAMCDMGMSYHQFMFISLSSRPKHVMMKEVGGKGFQNVESVEIVNSEVVLSGKKYAPDDAMCCPSIPFHTRYTIQGDAIIEVIADKLSPMAKDEVPTPL